MTTSAVLFTCGKGRLCGDQNAWRASGASNAIWSKNTADLVNVRCRAGIMKLDLQRAITCKLRRHDKSGLCSRLERESDTNFAERLVVALGLPLPNACFPRYFNWGTINTFCREPIYANVTTLQIGTSIASMLATHSPCDLVAYFAQTDPSP
jgi:hypothetical protein